MMLFKRQEGFTLVELLIVVVIIGILAAVAIPKFMDSVKNTQRQTCRNNLSQIETAVANWWTNNSALDDGSITPTLDSAATTGLIPTFMKRVVVCPASGSYQIAYYDSVTCTASSALLHTL